MTDEEKKAIDYLKNCLDNEYNFKNATRQKDKKAYNIILNLIEKQQKEIEELKAKNKILEAISLSFNEIQDRDKHWKDKIKPKIEEVSDGTYDAKIVLQSLLKKEFPTTITKEELEKRWKE
jgi:gas vesicle protein